MFYEHLHLGTPDYFKKEQGKNFSFPLHLHQCFELIVVQSGKMDITVDKKTYSLKKNECILIFPNQIHSLTSERSTHTLFIFSSKLVQAYSAKKTGLVPTDNRLTLDRYLLNKLCDLSFDSTSFELKGFLYTVCAEFDKICHYENKSSDSNLLAKIFSFVDNNYSADCTLKDLSHFLGYDYAYLSRFFKEATGISYNNYTNTYRLNNAGYLLENTDISVLECSIECGYKSLRSFNRNFKQFYGISPSEYRQKEKPFQNNMHPQD